VEVTGQKINRGAGYGLKVPCVYRLYGPKVYVAVGELSEKSWTSLGSVLAFLTLVISTAWDKINGGGVVSASALGSKNVRVKFCRGRCQCPLSGARRRPLLGGF
jgi:hypothetical protein